MKRESLLMIERYVLEGLENCPMNLNEIATETGLGKNVLRSILHNLKELKLVEQFQDTYGLKEGSATKGLALDGEVKDIFINLVNDYFRRDNEERKLKLKKIWMTPGEEAILNSMFVNLDSYIQNLMKDQRKKKQNGLHKDKKIIVWGMSKYSNLVESCLQYT